MERFGFILHPLDVRKDVAKRFRLLSRLPLRWLDFLSGYFPPVYLWHVTGIRTALLVEAEGWLVACPLTPRAMTQFPLRRVYRQIIRAGQLAERLGARIVGLGALTSAVGDAGETVARALKVPVTTGNSYTVAVTCASVHAIARSMGKPLDEMCVAVLGGTGSIGSACARLLCRRAGHVCVVGRDASAVQRVVDALAAVAAGTVSGATDLMALRDVDIVVSATNSAGPLIRPQHLRPGAAVYDLALPPDVSAAVREMGLDVTVYSGGDVIVPGTPDFGIDLGLPPGHAYACMAETIALALEGRYESYTLGRTIAPERVLTICTIAERHGFRPAPLRARGRLVDVPSCTVVV